MRTPSSNLTLLFQLEKSCVSSLLDDIVVCRMLPILRKKEMMSPKVQNKKAMQETHAKPEEWDPFNAISGFLRIKHELLRNPTAFSILDDSQGSGETSEKNPSEI